ncbi:hypothetical protein TNCV_54751 [Trichonephila clavipes]|nr:hypothetical protein TNCV_54751 [Trichonephila clavipes]
MYDPSSFANPTPLAHADALRDVLAREIRHRGGGGKILELAGNVVLVMKGASLDVGLGGCEDLRQYLLLKKWLARGVLGLKMMWK